MNKYRHHKSSSKSSFNIIIILRPTKWIEWTLWKCCQVIVTVQKIRAKQYNLCIEVIVSKHPHPPSCWKKQRCCRVLIILSSHPPHEPHEPLNETESQPLPLLIKPLQSQTGRQSFGHMERGLGINQGEYILDLSEWWWWKKLFEAAGWHCFEPTQTDRDRWWSFGSGWVSREYLSPPPPV